MRGALYAVLALVAAAAPSPPARTFVRIAGGAYRVGKADRLDNPVRKITLRPFEICNLETTNDEWSAFIQATGYVTDAERLHNAMVFEPGLPEFRWIRDPTASWRYPNGKTRGDLTGKGNHPVTSISYADALAYCKWARVRLPTLNEWEVACRGGTTTDYFFGSKPTGIGKYANIWHLPDHLKPDTSDGYLYTSPVGSFAPNPLGLYDIYGNVFEFCSGSVPSDKGRNVAHARGGSWWCSTHACCFFNSADIGRVNPHASFSNQGFRVVRDVEERR
jgi:sulfatase modifying factor 1